MNIPGALVGLAIAVVVAIALFVGIQEVVWGANAPSWYLWPDALGSFAIGSVGFYAGARR